MHSGCLKNFLSLLRLMHELSGLLLCPEGQRCPDVRFPTSTTVKIWSASLFRVIGAKTICHSLYRDSQEGLFVNLRVDAGC